MEWVVSCSWNLWAILQCLNQKQDQPGLNLEIFQITCALIQIQSKTATPFASHCFRNRVLRIHTDLFCSQSGGTQEDQSTSSALLYCESFEQPRQWIHSAGGQHPDIGNKEWETYFGTKEWGCCNREKERKTMHTIPTFKCEQWISGWGWTSPLHTDMQPVVAARCCCFFRGLGMIFKPFGEGRVLFRWRCLSHRCCRVLFTVGRKRNRENIFIRSRNDKMKKHNHNIQCMWIIKWM